MNTNTGTKAILQSLLVKKMKSNPSYSARAFARDIGLSPAFVSMLLKGQKKLSLARAIDIAKALKLDEIDKQRFINSALQESGLNFQVQKTKNKSEFVNLTEDEFNIIADWHHLAILDLASTKDFQPQQEWIAKRLGLKSLIVKDAIERLVKVGLLKLTNGKLKKTNRQLDLKTNTSLSAVRQHHRQMMELAIAELDKTDQQSFERRFVGSMTFAANSSRIQEARQKIQDFQDELFQFLTEGDCDEVYQLNNQLFALTKNIKETGK